MLMPANRKELILECASVVRDFIGSTRNKRFHKLHAVDAKVDILKQDKNRGFLLLPDVAGQEEEAPCG